MISRHLFKKNKSVIIILKDYHTNYLSLKMSNKPSNKHKIIYQNKKKDNYKIMMKFNIKWKQRIYHCYKKNQREKIQNQKQSVFLYRLMKTHLKYKQ